jgi:hypothetical protein
MLGKERVLIDGALEKRDEERMGAKGGWAPR